MSALDNLQSEGSVVRILHLEDDPSDALLIKALIDEAKPDFNASVQWVSNEKDYRAALHSGAIDLILSDHRMPGYNGDQALRDARSCCSQVPFIMLTGELGEAQAVETLKAGATDYVLKDGLQRLIPSIKRALKEGQLERERREMAQRLEEAQVIAHIGSWEWDIHTGIVHWSAELYAIVGVDPQAYSPTLASFGNLVHSDDRSLADGLIANVIATGSAVSSDLRIVRPDGIQRVLHVIGKVRKFSPEGKPLVIAGICQDITERKEAEEALAESERLYRGIIETAEEGIATHDPDGTITYVNQRMADMLGYSREEILGRSSLDFVDDAEKEKIIQGRESLKNKGSFMTERRLRRKDGSILWTLNNLSPRRDGAGNFLGSLAMHTDITERKKVEEALRESEERFRTMADSTPVMIWVTNAAGEIEMVNRAYEEFFGVTEAQVKPPSSWKILVHPEDEEGYVTSFTKAIQTQTPFNARARVKHRSGEWRWIHSYAAPRFSRDGTYLGLVGSSPDITEEERAKDALLASERNLRMMVDQGSDPMMVIGANGTIEAVSASGMRLLGYDAGGLIGKDVAEFAETFSRLEAVLALDNLRRQAPKSMSMTIRVKTGSAETRWIAITASLVNAGTTMEKYFIRFQKFDLPREPDRPTQFGISREA